MDIASFKSAPGTEKIKFKFHGKDEVLDIIDHHKELSEYLSNQDAECSLIGSKIVLDKVLGKGKFGAAFSITIPEFGPKEYVAKRLDKGLTTIKSEIQGSLKEIAAYYGERLGVSKKAMMALNKTNIYIDIGDTIYIPYYSKACLTNSDISIEPNDPDGVPYMIPKGSYVCNDETYPEFIIGSLCGNLNKKGDSINFFDTFGFSTCPNKGQVNQYVFMEKIDGTLAELIEEVQPEPWEIASLIIQTIHAIGVYQQKFRLQHTDLSIKNVFFQNVKPSSKFRGKKIYDHQHFHYKVADVDLYIPATSWIVKIGDYGMAVKFSDPIVAPEQSLQGDENIPNWYTENYDILYFLCNMFFATDGDPFVDTLLRYILKVEEDKDVGDVIFETFDENSGRPELWTLETFFKDLSPRSLLTNPQIMGEYMKRKENSIFMGSF